MVEDHVTPEPAPAVDLPPPPVMAAQPAPPIAALHEAPADVADAPDVDELQARLADLQAAMDQLQSGDLDSAEAAIEQLERAMAATTAHIASEDE